MRSTKPHVRLEHAWHRSPKLLRASSAKGIGDSAPLMWVAATTWCNENLKDGIVDRFTLASLTRHRQPEKVIQALVDAGAFVELEGGDIGIHDFLDHNPSRAEVERLRQARREGGAKGGRPPVEHPADPHIDLLLKQKRTSSEPSLNLQGSLLEPSPNLGPNQTEPISHLSSLSDQDQRDPPVGPPRPSAAAEPSDSPAAPAPTEVIEDASPDHVSGAELGSRTPITDAPSIAPKPSRKKPAKGCPPTGDAEAAVELWAAHWGISTRHPEFEKFLDYHRARSTLFADWAAAWRTWCRNAERFSAGRGNGHERPVQRTEGYQATEERKRAAHLAEVEAARLARGATDEDPFS
jgi:hypothetical protein